MNRKHTHGRRLTPGLVVALIALVAALTGSAIALPGKNTVDKNDIKKGAVKTKSLKDSAVTEPKIKDGAVSTPKLADGAVTTPKLSDGAATTPKLGDSAITTPKLADNATTTAKIADSAVSNDKVAADAIDSAKVEDESLTEGDLAPGVVRVVAYGRINNPDSAAPTLSASSVGFSGVSGGNADEGRTTVGVAAALLPPGGVPNCSVQATPAGIAQGNSSNTLGFQTILVATGSPAPTTQVQVQTRGVNEELNDFDYFLQVTCPNV